MLFIYVLDRRLGLYQRKGILHYPSRAVLSRHGPFGLSYARAFPTCRLSPQDTSACSTKADIFLDICESQMPQILGMVCLSQQLLDISSPLGLMESDLFKILAVF